MNKKSFVGIVLIVFVLVSQLHELLSIIPIIGDFYRGLKNVLPYPIPGELRNLLEVLLVTLTLMLLHRFGVVAALKDIGLLRPIWVALLVGILATLPMWITFSITAPLRDTLPWNQVLYLAFISPFAEEVVFRGFAFGQIRRHAGLGFWPAAIVTAVAFGVAHVGVNQDIGQAAGVFLITGGGGIFFAWLYEKWRYNLWVPFVVHCLMNLNWQIFEVGSSAFAGWLPTTLQVLVLISALLITKYRENIPYLSRA